MLKLLAFVLPLGLALGARIGERWRERAEQAAGIALILLGGFLLIEQLVRLSPQDRRANAPARMLGQVPGPPHVRCGCLAVCRVRWMLMPDGLGLMLGCGAS